MGKLTYLSAVAALAASATVRALHAEDAGVIDFHVPLIGVPKLDQHSTAPRFHRIHYPQTTNPDVPKPEKRNTAVFAATESNVLAALNPGDGKIVWRHALDSSDPILLFQTSQDVAFSLSGPGGSTARLFDALSGYNYWESALHPPRDGLLNDPPSAGVDALFANDDSHDIFVLSNGGDLRRLDKLSGTVKWEWSADPTSEPPETLYTRIAQTPTTLHIIGLTRQPSSALSLRIHALSSDTGALLSTHDLPSSLSHGTRDLLLARDALVWLEDGAAKAVRLSGDVRKISAVRAAGGERFRELRDVGLQEQGYFVGIRMDGAAEVVSTASEGKVLDPVWLFQESVDSTAYGPSLYTGSIDKAGKPFILRVYYSPAYKLTNVHIYSPHGPGNKGIMSGYTFPYDSTEHGPILHAAAEVITPNAYASVARLFLTTASGSVQLWTRSDHSWTREEGLAKSSVAVMVDLPEREAGALADTASGFLARLERHVGELQYLPSYLVTFATKFVSGAPEPLASAAASSELVRDTFGFRKLVLIGTEFGKLYALDTARHGEVLWSRYFGQGARVRDLVVVRSASVDGPARVLAAVERKDRAGNVSTNVVEVDAHTGPKTTDSGAFAFKKLFDSTAIKVLPLEIECQSSKIRATAFVDQNLEIHLYPACPTVRASFASLAPYFHFAFSSSPAHLLGYNIHVSSNTSGTPVFHARSTWGFALAPAEVLTSVRSKPATEVASVARVTGDRDALRKYLNPHLLLVNTRNAEKGTAAVYLVDAVSGRVRYHAEQEGVSADPAAQAAFEENLLVYPAFQHAREGAPDTPIIVTAELYESQDAGSGWSSHGSSSVLSEDPEAVSQAFALLPGRIDALAFTKTRHGISNKDVLVANDKNQIIYLPQRMLDPRRPTRAPTAEEREEMLMQYDPLIVDDPRRVLSHKYDVIGTREILTSPAALESTSIVFTHGLDLFGTRFAPSRQFDVLSQAFNKPQLVLTIGALSAAIIFVKPIVRGKKLKAKWY